MSIAVWLALDLMDEDEMREAKRRLRYAEKHGIERTVWNIYESNTKDFPHYERGFFEKLFIQNSEFKSSLESSRDYVSRLVRSGQNIQHDGKIYVVKNKVGLEFRLQDEGIRTTDEKIQFYDVNRQSTLGGLFVDLEDVEGVVEVRYHDFGLYYGGWNMKQNLHLDKGKSIARPYKIVFVSGVSY